MDTIIDRLESGHIAVKRGSIGTVLPIVDGKIDADLLKARIDAMCKREEAIVQHPLTNNKGYDYYG